MACCHFYDCRALCTSECGFTKQQSCHSHADIFAQCNNTQPLAHPFGLVHACYNAGRHRSTTVRCRACCTGRSCALSSLSGCQMSFWTRNDGDRVGGVGASVGNSDGVSVGADGASCGRARCGRAGGHASRSPRIQSTESRQQGQQTTCHGTDSWAGSLHTSPI